MDCPAEEAELLKDSQSVVVDSLLELYLQVNDQWKFCNNFSMHSPFSAMKRNVSSFKRSTGLLWSHIHKEVRVTVSFGVTSALIANGTRDMDHGTSMSLNRYSTVDIKRKFHTVLKCAMPSGVCDKGGIRTRAE